MRPSKVPMWFAAIVGIGGLAILPFHFGFGLQWCLLWFGLAIFFAGGRDRFPGFAPLPPPASLGQLGIPRRATTGALSNPWWMLLILGVFWACTAAVPLMIPSTSLLGFAIAIALTLVGHAYWLSIRQRATVKMAKRLLGRPASDERRISGTVKNEAPALSRETFWFGISGVHYGTERVQSVYGGETTVVTATPTSNTYGYRQERRGELLVEADGVATKVDATRSLWAAPVEPLRSAPELDQSALGPGMGAAYVRSGEYWEREQIGPGQNVVALGIWDADARCLRGEKNRPALLFAVGKETDPQAHLRRRLWRHRLPMIVLVLFAAASVAAALYVPLPVEPTPVPQVRPLPVES